MAYNLRNEHDLYEILGDIALMQSRFAMVGGNGLREIPWEQIRFDGWPRLDITLRGERFGGGLPARIMPALFKYQWMIDRALARSLHTNARGLTTSDRKRIELIISLNQSSTSVNSDLSEPLNYSLDVILRRNDVQAVLLILALAGIQGLGIWKAHIEAETRRHQMAYNVQMSKEETKRLQIVTRLADNSAHVRANLDDMAETRNALLRCLDDRDKLLVDGEFLVDGRIGRRIARKPRATRVQELRDSTFFIERVDTGPDRRGYLVRVREVESDETLRIAIPDDLIPQDQLSVLRQAEWDKLPVRMQINVATVGEDVVKATLVGVISPAE